jgi:hypothetical protein
MTCQTGRWPGTDRPIVATLTYVSSVNSDHRGVPAGDNDAALANSLRLRCESPERRYQGTRPGSLLMEAKTSEAGPS